MRSAADRHIFQRSYRLFLGIDHLQLFHASFFELPPHDLRQRTDLCFINIRHTECRCIQLIACSHAADDRYTHFLRLHDKCDLGSNRIYRIHHIVIFFKWEGICIFRQEKAFVYCHLRIRIDLQDTFLHHIRFIFADCLSCGNDLSV